MNQQIVIEWERISLGGVLVNHYLARLVEPITTGHFATVIHEGGAWRVIWYPSGISSQVQSFEVSSLEKGQSRVEQWAAHHGLTLRPQDYPGRCDTYSYERRSL